MKYFLHISSLNTITMAYPLPLPLRSLSSASLSSLFFLLFKTWAFGYRINDSILVMAGDTLFFIASPKKIAFLRNLEQVRSTSSHSSQISTQPHILSLLTNIHPAIFRWLFQGTAAASKQNNGGKQRPICHRHQCHQGSGHPGASYGRSVLRVGAGGKHGGREYIRSRKVL